MAQNGLKWPPKAILSTLGSYSGSLHRIWDHWAIYWCKKEEKLAPKWVQFGPIQELVSGVLEARGINRHNFFDYFPPLGTHTKWFMQKKSLARTIKIPRGFTHFECTTVDRSRHDTWHKTSRLTWILARWTWCLTSTTATGMASCPNRSSRGCSRRSSGANFTHECY